MGEIWASPAPGNNNHQRRYITLTHQWLMHPRLNNHTSCWPCRLPYVRQHSGPGVDLRSVLHINTVGGLQMDVGYVIYWCTILRGMPHGMTYDNPGMDIQCIHHRHQQSEKRVCLTKERVWMSKPTDFVTIRGNKYSMSVIVKSLSPSAVDPMRHGGDTSISRPREEWPPTEVYYSHTPMTHAPPTEQPHKLLAMSAALRAATQRPRGGSKERV